MQVRNYFLIVLMLSMISTLGYAQNKKKLQFNNNGKFKIAQFTDIHYKPGNPESDPSVELIRKIINTEKPDLITFTGDIVTGTPLAEGWKAVLEPVIEANIPFAFTPGNHDDEHDLTRQQINKLLKGMPGYVGKNPSASSDYGDYMLTINNDNNKSGALLYFLDSKAYSTLERVEGYGWFSIDQVNWYTNQSKKNYKKWKSNLPALAFFHIPLPEYHTAFESEAKHIGQKNENECAPILNTGMFSSMLHAGEVMGTFVGHDHVNDYLVNYYDIGLAYGRWSGGKTTYGDLVHGSRIIVLEPGKHSFETWIRLSNDDIIDKITFPDDLK